MTTLATERTLDYTPIVGPGVDALDRRREHNDNDPVTAAKLRASVNKVETGLTAGLNALVAGASDAVRK